MNLHYKLFQSPIDYRGLYYQNSSASFMNSVMDTCKNSDDEKNCLEKQQKAFDLTFDILVKANHREERLDWKYDKMAKHKFLRGDKDARYKPFV